MKVLNTFLCRRAFGIYEKHFKFILVTSMITFSVYLEIQRMACPHWGQFCRSSLHWHQTFLKRYLVASSLSPLSFVCFKKSCSKDLQRTYGNSYIKQVGGSCDSWYITSSLLYAFLHNLAEIVKAVSQIWSRQTF